MKEDELDPANAVEDRWLVIGQRIDDRGDIVTARTFLLGETSARIGLHLAFGVGAAPPTLLAVPGQAFRATVTFYPSATPLRVAVQPPIVPDGEATAIPHSATLGGSRRGPRRAPRPKPVRRRMAGRSSATSCRSCGATGSSCGMPKGPRCRS